MASDKTVRFSESNLNDIEEKLWQNDRYLQSSGISESDAGRVRRFQRDIQNILFDPARQKDGSFYLFSKTEIEKILSILKKIDIILEDGDYSSDKKIESVKDNNIDILILLPPVKQGSSTLSANELVFDATLRHQIWLRRFASGEVRRNLQLLEEHDKEAVEFLRKKLSSLAGKPVTPEYLKRVKAMLDGLAEKRQAALSTISESMQENLVELATDEVVRDKSSLEENIPILIVLGGVAGTVLRGIPKRPIQGKTLKDWISRLTTNDRFRLERAIQLSLLEGQSAEQIIKRVVGTRINKYRDGVLTETRREIDALIRTSVTAISNSAREEFWRENEKLINFLRWTSVLDGRTTAICRSRDGKIFRVGEGPRPPAHFNCRSIMVPVIDGTALLGERMSVTDTRTEKQLQISFTKQAKEAHGDTWASLTQSQKEREIAKMRDEWAKKHVSYLPTNITYEQFLRRQSREFIEDVLGKKKAKLFLEGGLRLDNFVDETGKEYTLKELRSKTPESFEKAGIE